jgi:hypothetical protein
MWNSSRGLDRRLRQLNAACGGADAFHRTLPQRLQLIPSLRRLLEIEFARRFPHRSSNSPNKRLRCSGVIPSIPSSDSSGTVCARSQSDLGVTERR